MSIVEAFSVGNLICVIGFMYGYDYTWLCGVVIGLGCMFVYRDYDSFESEV